MDLDPRFTCKPELWSSWLVWNAGVRLVRLVGLGILMATSACTGPARQVSPVAAAEKNASQVIIDRCSKSIRQDVAKAVCQFHWDVFGRAGVRWAASHLNPDGSLRESRAVFDVTLRERTV